MVMPRFVKLVFCKPQPARSKAIVVLKKDYGISRAILQSRSLSRSLNDVCVHSVGSELVRNAPAKRMNLAKGFDCCSYERRFFYRGSQSARLALSVITRANSLTRIEFPERRVRLFCEGSF